MDCPHYQTRINQESCHKCGRSTLAEVLSTVSVSPRVNPSRKNAPPRQPNNSFERGIRKDDRGVPYLDKNGKALRMKEGFNRRDYGQSVVTIN